MALCFVIIFLGIPAQSSAQAHPDNLVVILDASGSMRRPMPGTNQPKMDVAKDALLRVVAQAPANTHLGLLVFGAKSVRNPWVYPLGPVDQAVFSRAVMSVQPSGNTPLGRFMKVGADRLLEQRQTQHGLGTFRLLVVTDGEASDRRLVERVVPMVLSRGITVDVIGVAMASDHTLATRVHSYRRGNDPASLTQAIQASLAEIGAGQDDTSVDQESFAIIASLPDGLAQAALEALHGAGNEPIGKASSDEAASFYERPVAEGQRQSVPGASGLPTGLDPGSSQPQILQHFSLVNILSCFGAGVILVIFLAVFIKVVKR